MPLLIDTFNVLHTTGVLPAEAAGIDVDDLIGLLQNSRYRRHRITLVCDGKGRSYSDPTLCGGLEVRYSGSARPADDIIHALIAKNTAPRQLLVVTSDQEILRAARRRRCPVLKSAGFLHQIAADLETAFRRSRTARQKLDPQLQTDVKHWMEAFGLDDRELERLASIPADEPAKPTAKKKPIKEQPQDPSPKPEPKTPADDLPSDIIEQAEALWQKQSARKKPPGKKSKKSANKSPKAAAKTKSNDQRGYDTKRVRQSRINEIRDGDADSIDMQKLMPDVKPIDPDE